MKIYKMREICDILIKNRVKKIIFSNCNITNYEIQDICRIISNNRNLKYLILNNNLLGTRGAIILSSVINYDYILYTS